MESSSCLSTPSAEIGNRSLPDLLTVVDAGGVLRVSRKTVDKLIASGQLAAAKVGGQWRIRREALHEYIRKAEKRNKQAA